MNIVIRHNPKCSTAELGCSRVRYYQSGRSRKHPTSARRVLAMIRAVGSEPRVVEYVKMPPSPGEIKAALKEMGLAPRELPRRRGTPYDELGLVHPGKTDAELIAAMAAHPILIERPVVRTRKGTQLCRPPERVKEIL